MARWHTDDVDIACESWAYQWVANFGRDPDRASAFIGPCGCTLGSVLERHDGAASSTEHDRQFPETYLGEALVIAIALSAMPEGSRDIVWSHYVARVYDADTWKRRKRPLKQMVIAQRLGVSLAEYYQRRDVAKACIRTALTLDTKALASARGQMLQSRQVGSVPLRGPACT